LHPLNGYLYGRGVTDNKAPILAALYAVADLARHGTLTCNVVFLIEGEEEAGSRGFVDAVRRNRDRIGDVDFILLSNSYWLDDHIPCLTYGMRGVIHASLTVASGKPDRHSGMDGKASVHEPLKDLVLLLGILGGASGTSVQVPGFYDDIAELTDEERRQYSEITSTLMPGHPEIKDPDAFTKSLIQRWREPNFTLHRVDVPKSKTAVTIPRFAEATLSIRIVPGQDAEEIAADLVSFAKKEFRGLRSTNKLDVHIASMADAWLGDPSNEIFQALESAVTEVWTSDDSSFEMLRQRKFSAQSKSKKSTPPPSPINASPQSHPHRRASTLASRGSFNAENMPRKPLYIREGGSIPTISFLEREFSAPAAMFPMGQASDNAHLGNERMRVENLYKGREVFKKVFAQL
jgi:di- and tripeptidase